MSDVSRDSRRADDQQRQRTIAHMRQFESAIANLEGGIPGGHCSKLAKLEIDALTAIAGDLRAEVDHARTTTHLQTLPPHHAPHNPE